MEQGVSIPGKILSIITDTVSASVGDQIDLLDLRPEGAIDDANDMSIECPIPMVRPFAPDQQVIVILAGLRATAVHPAPQP
jgi:hypothetical protein